MSWPEAINNQCWNSPSDGYRLLGDSKMNQTLPEQQALRGYISERKRAERMRKVGMWGCGHGALPRRDLWFWQRFFCGGIDERF